MIRLMFVACGFAGLSGCVAPLAIAANTVANEAISTVSKPTVSVTGADLTDLATWDETYPIRALSVAGGEDWTCAAGEAGTDVCVPEEDMPSDEEDLAFTPTALFSCSYGTGGPITSAVAQDETTLYCKQV
ncbi:MAG: hypothetical protein AAFU59_05085 [Pseudomonadota bacterium]